MKTLITWFGFNEDYKQVTPLEINILPTGFTGSIHKDIFDQRGFDRHIILFTQDQSGELAKGLKRREFLIKDFLNDQYPKRKIEIKCIIKAISDEKLSRNKINLDKANIFQLKLNFST